MKTVWLVMISLPNGTVGFTNPSFKTKELAELWMNGYKVGNPNSNVTVHELDIED
jgi:hypothetical protein